MSARLSWRCERCGVPHLDDSEVCPGARRCCVCGHVEVSHAEVLLAKTTTREVLEAIARQDAEDEEADR